jgi:hypothetical protein
MDKHTRDSFPEYGNPSWINYIGGRSQPGPLGSVTETRILHSDWTSLPTSIISGPLGYTLHSIRSETSSIASWHPYNPPFSIMSIATTNVDSADGSQYSDVAEQGSLYEESNEPNDKKEAKEQQPAGEGEHQPAAELDSNGKQDPESFDSLPFRAPKLPFMPFFGERAMPVSSDKNQDGGDSADVPIRRPTSIQGFRLPATLSKDWMVPANVRGKKKSRSSAMSAIVRE